MVSPVRRTMPVLAALVASVIVFVAGLVGAGCGSHEVPSARAWSEAGYFAGEAQTAGAATSNDVSRTALGRVLSNLAPERWMDVLDGKRVFERTWRAGGDAGTASQGRDRATGLGPLYNADSCIGCHFLDGRGGSLSEVVPDVRLLARLAVGEAGDPTYGRQLSELATNGLASEGQLVVAYVPRVITLGDGTQLETRRPMYRWAQPAWGPPDPHVQLSPRMPSALVGLGLLEAIDTADLIAAQDPEDRDHDGISGRANVVEDAATGRLVIGRFGWKAGQPNIEQQIATALRDDMGLTSWLRPESACTARQRACRAQDVAGDVAPEVSRRDLERLATYVRLLAAPRRRTPEAPEVRRGRAAFIEAGCASCHTPRQRTGRDVRFPELARQTIFPYSDLLLHDMGDELADGVREGEAAGPEWRTPPLWGLGLLPAIHGRIRLLHDGRARSVEEAVLWHGGEARAARDHYARLPAVTRGELVRVVESL